MLVLPRCVSTSSSSAFVFTQSAFLPFSPLDHSHNGKVYGIGRSLFLFLLCFFALFLFPLQWNKIEQHPEQLNSCGHFCLPHDPTDDNNFRESSANSGCDGNAKAKTFSHLRRLSTRNFSSQQLFVVFSRLFLESRFKMSRVFRLYLISGRDFQYFSVLLLLHEAKLLLMMQSLREYLKTVLHFLEFSLSLFILALISRQ